MADTAQQPHSILVMSPTTAAHGHADKEMHVKFNVPENAEHHHERPRSRTHSPPTQGDAPKKTVDVPMDEVEMLHHGLRTVHGECLDEEETPQNGSDVSREPEADSS